MLTIEARPNPLQPHPVTRPVIWQFRNPQHTVTASAPAQIIFVFTAGGGANGQTFQVAGQDLETDDAVPYTATTFDYAADVETAAQNFAGMLQSNYRFYDWAISVVEQVGVGWQVVATAASESEDSEVANSTDLAFIAPPIATQADAGTDRVLRNERLWYQLWEGAAPISERLAVVLGDDGRVRVDITPVARRVIDIIDPYLLWVRPELDPFAHREIYLRYGLYELDDDCNRGFSSAFETGPVDVINSVRQPEDLRDLRPNSPDYSLPVRWLDTRPNDRCVYRDGFEFSAIWCNGSALIPEADFRVLYTYYNSADVEISTSQRGFREFGFFHVPTGARNFCHDPNIIAASAYYTVVIQFNPDGGDWLDYSETLTLTLVEDNCLGAEVYYLDELGAWATMRFDRVEGRRLEMEEISWTTPLDTTAAGFSPNGIQLYHEGGRDNRADNPDSVFLLATPPIARGDHDRIEQFLLSPRHFLLTSSDLFSVGTRRVLFDRTAYGTFTRGQATRVVVAFRFNESKRNR